MLNCTPISSFAILVALSASRGIWQYFRQHFLDRTFQGLYHANAFDMALLIPYFVVLVLLASYLLAIPIALAKQLRGRMRGVDRISTIAFTMFDNLAPGAYQVCDTAYRARRTPWSSP